MNSPIEYGVARPEQIKGKTGLEIMRGILNGELPAPPIAQTLNFRMLEVNDGHVILKGLPIPVYSIRLGQYTAVGL